MEERNLPDDEQRTARSIGNCAGAIEDSGGNAPIEPGRGRVLSRRGALRAGAAAVGGAAGLVAAPGSATANRGRTRHGIEFARILHAVDDLGMDPEGEESIDDLIDWREGTLIEFPTGRFAYDGDWKSGLTRYGWVAEDRRADPVLVPSKDIHDTSTIAFVYWDEGEDLLFGGIDFDFTEPEHGGWLAMKIRAGVGFWEDVTVKGPWPDHEDYSAFFSPYTTAESARLEVRNFTAMDGWEGYAKEQGENANYHPIGVWVAYPHTGEVLFDDCAIGYFPDNGLYADGAGLSTDKGYSLDGGGGVVQVENCYFENNNISNIRIGTTGSYAKNCTVVIDDDCPTHANGSNARGVWLRYEPDIVVKNVDVEVTGHRGSGGIVEGADGGGNVVKNVDIKMGSDANYIAALNREGSGADTGSTYKNLRVVSALPNADLSAGRGAIDIDGAEGTTIRNSCVETTTPDSDGVRFVDSTALVRNTNVDATGEPIVAENSTVETEHVTYREGCGGRGRRGSRGDDERGGWGDRPHDGDEDDHDSGHGHDRDGR